MDKTATFIDIGTSSPLPEFQSERERFQFFIARLEQMRAVNLERGLPRHDSAFDDVISSFRMALEKLG